MKKGQKYLTVVCNHLTGKVVWAAKGRSKETVGAFFDALGEDRAKELAFVSCDGAEWIRTVVAERAAEAVVCLDNFHVVSWATAALDEVRRQEWNRLRHNGGAKAAKEFKGLRWLLLRNWENLSPRQKGTIRDLEKANKRSFRAWQLKEELRDLLQLPPARATEVIADWLYFAKQIQARALRQAGSHHPPTTGSPSRRRSSGASRPASRSRTTPPSAGSDRQPEAFTTRRASSP
ncbi:MAG: ISL3 family transposase [Acidimicrobiales bacterium]